MPSKRPTNEAAQEQPEEIETYEEEKFVGLKCLHPGDVFHGTQGTVTGRFQQFSASAAESLTEEARKCNVRLIVE